MKRDTGYKERAKSG